MDTAEVAAYIGRWRPSSVSPQAAAFARDVITKAGPQGRERAKNLLWAAGRLADFGLGLGLDAAPEVLLHPSVAERFTRCAPGLSGVTRRTLRTNLRFIGRRVVPQLYPADMPLPREHAKEPYSPAEIAGYLASADAQPTVSRRMRSSGLVCLGAGAGLIRADLRAVHGTDVICRSGGVIVAVRGARPRAVPVLARYHGRLLAAAAIRRDRADLRRDRSRPAEHHHAADPVAGRRGRAAPAGHLPAARHLAGRSRGPARPGHVHARRRDHLLPAARRPARRPGTRRGAGRGPAARGGPAVMIPLPVLEEIVDRSGIAPQIELLLPIGVRARQLLARTLLLGMLIVLADHRPAHLTRVHQALTSAARGRPAAARRGRGLETRPAPADLPPDRADLRPGHRRDGQGRPRRAALRPAAAHLRRPAGSLHPRPVQECQPARWPSTGPTWKPSPARRPAAPATAPTPKPPGDTAPAAAPARTASCSSATTPPPPP